LNDMVDHFCAVETFNFVSFSSASLVRAQFPGSCGLEYRNVDTKAVCGVRFNEGRLFPPSVDAGWGEYLYFCVFPKDITWFLQLKEAPKFIL